MFTLDGGVAYVPAQLAPSFGSPDLIGLQYLAGSEECHLTIAGCPS